MHPFQSRTGWRNGYRMGEYKANTPTPSAAGIGVQMESTLAQRVPAALTLKIKQTPEVFASGMAEVDAMLGGGIPRGTIT